MSRRSKFGLVSAVILLCVSPAWAADTVLILSSSEPEYQAVAAGFKPAFTGTLREINLEGSDLKLKAVGEQLQAAKPGLAVVVGDLAAQLAKWYLEGIPVIYCDAIRAAKITLTTGKTLGIYHEPDPEEQLKIMHQLFPGKSRIGLLFSPEYAKFNPQKIQEIAQALGLTLVMAPLNSIQEVPAKFREIIPRVDLLWVCTDPVVLCSHSIQYIVLQTISSGVPIFCGDNYLAHLGATAAMVPDQTDVGLKAAQAAKQWLSGSKPAAGTILYPKGKLVLNHKVSALLKISFPPDLVGQAGELIQ